MATKTLNIGNTSNSITIDINENGNLLPAANATYSLGSSDKKWNYIYGNLKGNADSSDYPYGFAKRVSYANWINGDASSGGFTTTVTQWDDSSTGSVSWQSNNSGQLSECIDGYYYQGRDERDGYLHRCLDTYDLTNTIDTTYVKKAGDTMTGPLFINATGSTTASPVVIGTSSKTNINASVSSGTTTMLQIVDGDGSSTNGGAIGFHNPMISSATIGYYNSATSTGAFKFRSDNSYWDVLIGGSSKLGTVWSNSNLVVGNDSYDKAVIGYLPSSTNGVVIGAHSAALDAWAPINLSGTQVNLRYQETLAAKVDSNRTFSVYPGGGNYNEGIRIHASSNNVSEVMFCGSDNTGDTGTTDTSWAFYNQNGTLYLNHGSSGENGSNYMSVTDSYWKFCPQVGINGKNSSYNFYVNGTTHHTNRVTIEGTSGGPYLTVNYNSRYDSDNTLDNYGINLIKFGKSAMDNYLGTCLNTSSTFTGKQNYVFHTGSSYGFGWFTSGWTKVMELEASTGNLYTKGNIYFSGSTANYINASNYTGAAAYLSNASHSITIGKSTWSASNPWSMSNKTLVWGQQGYNSSYSGDTADICLYYGNTSASGGAGWFLMIDGGIYALGAIYGAVWNDYAEFRQANATEPGRCVIENGDDTLSLSTKRLQRGAEIISDTFGFAIGETDDCKTPIAATGRVLAYTYEPRDEYRKHVGEPVCSGPNGTVSLMTEEEETKYPSRIIGFVSAVPDYEEWGTGKVKVNGRVWIRVR